MKRVFTLGAAMLMLSSLMAAPSFAQDKMSGAGAGKMSDSKMSGGKMSGGTKLSGAALMSKATGGLSPEQRKYVMDKMAKMTPDDKKKMQEKLAGYPTTVRKAQVTKMMNADKMGGKMSGDKMGGKMSGDKMGGKMSGNPKP